MLPHIFVPVDGSPNPKTGLGHALTTYPDATFTVLHASSPYDQWDVDDPPLPAEASEERFETARRRADEVFEEARAVAADHGVELSTTLEVGDAGRVIVEYAVDHGVDHIVMGSHGRSGRSALHLGSVAETVTRRSPVTVTVVR